ncbi:MAG: glycosyltransferase [Actinomycetota bacterium]|nr:glycosyltransferase [Actinomycetota bacterium]
MKSLLLSHSDGGGGAGRAAYRLQQALVAAGVDSRMHVDFKDSEDPLVTRNQGPFADLARRLRITIEEVPAVLAKHPQPQLFAPGMMSAISARRINASDADIINAHWTNFGYLSIGQIARITKPFVWSLHDMWAFTGGRNYAPDNADARWRTGYRKDNRRPQEHGWDIERWVAGRKERAWTRPHHVITSSTWMSKLAAESPLLAEWPVHVIPNAVDTQTYAPMASQSARTRFGINPGASLVVVALPTHLDDPRKGFDLLKQALAHLVRASRQSSGVELAVVGHGQAPVDWPAGLPPTHWLGYLDDQGCVDAYNAADVVVVPSRQDNSPQTATEALSCGAPVVAFRTSGLPDFVTHRETGYLAQPEDPIDLAAGIEWVLADAQRRSALASRARDRAVELWSAEVVGKAHRQLFESIIGQGQALSPGGNSETE